MFPEILDRRRGLPSAVGCAFEYMGDMDVDGGLNVFVRALGALNDRQEDEDDEAYTEEA